MHITCENVSLEFKDELIVFLKKREEYSLFLLSNLDNFGLKLADAQYSGNFKVLREQSEIIAAFCLTKNGTLLVQSLKMDDSIYDGIIQSCLEEKIPISGLIGEWEFAYGLWKLIKEMKIIDQETFREKEVLYTLDVAKTAFEKQSGARLLQAADFEQWIALREAYVEEMGFPKHPFEEVRKEFLTKVSLRITWGLFLQNDLIAIADLNAIYSDLGQLGGVYTLPPFRKKGLCTRLICHLIQDIKFLHGIKKLMIFTGENNVSARRVYESLGISPFGHYALLFGVSR